MIQRTLKEPLTIKGIGLHSGCDSVLVINPAPVNTGIVFCRTDVAGAKPIAATYNNVVDTRNCTCLGQDGVLVSTIEHLMAALYAAQIDNAYIECNNQELPIADGSGKVFYGELAAAPKQEQNAGSKFIEVLKPVEFADGKGGSVKLLPNGGKDLNVHFEIEFSSKIVGHQVFDAKITPEIFSSQIALCRTFCEKYQIEYLKSLGLIKGGRLDNAVVLDGDTILNPEGFRVKNECVNHKVLDLIGDMYTSGYRLVADVVAVCSGHFHNNEILKKLFADATNYKVFDGDKK